MNAHNAAEFGIWSGTNSFTTAAVTGGITIIPTFDSSITSDPQAAVIEATIRSALVPYQTDFSDAITVTIKFQEMGSGLGLSSWSYNTYSYSTYRAALVTNATTADDMTALAHLPTGTGNPVNGNQNIEVKLPLARALGFSANPQAGQMDGTISLNTASMNLSAGQMDPTRYSLFATVCHEVDEVLALGSALDQVNKGNLTLTGVIFPEDLFRYDQTGARNYTTNVSATAYFSLDGTTDLAQFNQWPPGTSGIGYSFAAARRRINSGRVFPARRVAGSGGGTAGLGRARFSSDSGQQTGPANCGARRKYRHAHMDGDIRPELPGAGRDKFKHGVVDQSGQHDYGDRDKRELYQYCGAGSATILSGAGFVGKPCHSERPGRTI